MSFTGTPRDETRGLADQIKGLISDISVLFRQEVELAKTEAGERLESAIHGAVMLAVGAILAVGALGVLLSAAVVGLAGFLENIGMDPYLANALSALVVAIVVGGVGWAIIASGINRLKATNFKMERTVHSLSEDANVVKERL